MSITSVAAGRTLQVASRVQPAKRLLSVCRRRVDSKIVNPMLLISFIYPNHEIVRNEFGIPLRKTVDTLFVFRKNEQGKCYAQWRSFGYESLGGAAFSNEMGAWTKRDDVVSFYYVKIDGGHNVEASLDNEVDCAPFESRKQ